jgi:alpha-galactosidase
MRAALAMSACFTTFIVALGHGSTNKGVQIAIVHKYGKIKVSESSSQIAIDTGPLQITFSKGSGLASYAWDGTIRVHDAYSGVRIGSVLKTTEYTKHAFSMSDMQPLSDGFGRGIKLNFVNTADGKPALRQTYFLYEDRRYFLLEVSVESNKVISTNWLAPIQVDRPAGVDIGSSADPRVLIVPWDNDHFIRYRSEPINSATSSYEVTSIYDNSRRKGLVVGSITHDTWKTGIDYSGSNGRLDALSVYGGASSSVTQDTMPHGFVSGTAVLSPRILVGYYDDWRTGMEEFASANSIMSPPLPWAGGMPVGWNSWAAYRCGINSETMLSVSDFVRNNLQNRGFGNEGVVYINWDSACGSGTRPDYDKVAERIRQNGQHPGIYFVPFARFGKGRDDAPVPGTGGQYTWNDLFLRDANNVPIATDGGRALDPTHPGTRMYVESTLNTFKQWGYEFVKLDFLSHGAIEGKHYLQGMTAMQAYNYGMRYIRDALAGRMFVSLSIAPLFPGGEYANSRRISCDAFGSIKEIEYMLNAVTYGWWLGKYYRYNDGDLVVVGPNRPNEARSRVIASAITGMFLDSDQLANDPASQERAKDLLTRRAILAVARIGKTFRPLEGNTGDRATDTFVFRDGRVFYLAVFNYQDKAVTKSINLARAGLDSRAKYRAGELWSGTSSAAQTTISVPLQGSQAAIYALQQ